jgi:D-alanyl-D-alanine carboxypeptidase/D-alanyl-D-alanine-endopeptidase (penicillin-binding protein 4)
MEGTVARSSAVRVAAVLGALGAFAGAAAGQEMNGRIETIIASAKIGPAAVVGVSAIDVETGRTLADIRGDAPLIPASNQKLLTTGTALVVLGPEFLFKTEVVLSGDRLVLRGGGDPAFADPTILDRMTPKLTVDRMVEALAGAVSTAGIASVTEVIADDRVFDRNLVHETWPKDQLDRWYCAPVSGLNFHTNVVSLFPAPAKVIGQAPWFEIQPNAPWFEIENRARTVGEGGKNSVWLARDDAGGYTLHGEVRFASRSPIEVTVFDPAVLFAQLMAVELPRAGVSVGGIAATPGKRLSSIGAESAIRMVRLASTDEKLDGRVLAVVSTHMKDVIQRCNADSQNLYAEAILKRIGHEVTKEPGSWENGSSIVRMTLSQDEELGPKYAASTVVADGSGMSREDQVAPRTLAKWLARLQKHPTFGEMFVDSLATPGDGTLRKRFQGAELAGELKAKSGKIAGVRCLSGYVTDPVTKRRVAFSVMINNMKDSDPQPSLKLHEDVVVAIDRWLVAQRPERTATAPVSSVTRKRR